MTKITACVDGANYTEAVCDYAAWAAMRVDAALEFLHVLVPSPQERLDASGSIGLGAHETLLAELADLDQRRNTLAREHGQRILESAQQRAVSSGVKEVGVRQRHGELVETLLELEDDTRLFVLGQHDYKHKPKRFLLDHNLEGAVRTLKRPILVATGSFQPPRSFLIAFDASATGRAMVEMVANSPMLRGLQGVIATVGGDAEALDHAAETLRHAGFDIDTERLDGEPADALLGFAKQKGMDMLVMGAYGHSRIRQWMVGSTTTTILRRTDIPAFILR
ncbi:universal stress protein [Pusillimonas sp.]|uniref:universal stress protein n=1 Tax=Pusillimonas sp. TaxID=3040095 RepID=UPI0037C8F07C